MHKLSLQRWRATDQGDISEDGVRDAFAGEVFVQDFEEVGEGGHVYSCGVVGAHLVVKVIVIVDIVFIWLLLVSLLPGYRLTL